VPATPELVEVMPLVSRALKRKDRPRAERLLEAALADKTLSRRAVAALLGTSSGASVPADLGPLTRAQWVVLWAGACGLTARETAERYHRGEETVKSHRKEAGRRLGVTGNIVAAAVAECYRRGIFDRNDPLEPVDLTEW
jgi:DNA-binding NarL/FixJ family response regulator